MQYMAIFVRVKRYFLQFFNKFGNLGLRKNSLMPPKKLKKKLFLKFELKLFFEL
jgi:hypothetical protein